MWVRLSLGLVAACAAATTAAAEAPPVVLITLDTTRADRMGFLGSAKGLTPHLDALARRSVAFELAYAQAPLTTVSHATLLSGTHPPFHRVSDFGVPLEPRVPWLPDILRARGFRTAAFVAALVLDPRAGFAAGFDRGFDEYDAGFRIRRAGEDRYRTLERRGAEVVARALRWLDGRPAGPFLLWVHLYDPHDPYDPPRAFARPGRSRYDAEVAAADAAVGTLLAGLEARRLLDPALVVIAADHGESLGEHGETTHGVFLYDATLHVPLLVKLPGPTRAGGRVKARVGLVDVAPTILSSLGVPAPAQMQGRSLAGLLEGKPEEERPSYAETEYPQRGFGWSTLASWRVGRFLFVRAPRRELYDASADPAERHDLSTSRSALADRLAAQLEAFRTQISPGAAAAGPRPIDPELAQRLGALGYVSGGAPVPVSTGIDPKDRIAVANTLHDAIVAMEDGAPERAVPLLERVVRSDPQIPTAQLQLGIARARQRQYPQSIAPLRKAIELQPDSMQAHYEMGLVLFETGQWKTAAGHFEIVAAKMPKFADARFSLGSVYARIDRVEEAIAELKAALELEPRHYRANLLLGRILTLQGRAEPAVPYLQRAAEAQPSSVEAQAFLADAYQALGRATDAAHARARAQRLRKP